MHNWKWISAAVAVATIGVAHAQTQVPQTLVVAAYDTEDGAKDAFAAMKQTQREGVILIDSYAVVSKDQKGKVHVHSTQRRGAIAGSIVGALVGLLGGPAGVVAGAAAGGGLGFLTGNAVGIPRETIDAMKSSLQPGTSAIVAVIDERWVADLERAFHQAKAKSVLDHKIMGGGTEPEKKGETPAPATNPPPANPPPAPNP